jgi:choline dehydrogenase
VLPAFRRHEDHWRLDQPEGVNENFKRLHGNKATGSTGEWRVEKQRLRWDILDAFAQAAQQAGIPATDDFNRGTNEAWATSRSTRKRLALEHGQGLLRPTCYGRPNFECGPAPRPRACSRARPTAACAAPAWRCGRAMNAWWPTPARKCC